MSNPAAKRAAKANKRRAYRGRAHGRLMQWAAETERYLCGPIEAMRTHDAGGVPLFIETNRGDGTDRAHWFSDAWAEYMGDVVQESATAPLVVGAPMSALDVAVRDTLHPLPVFDDEEEP